MLVSIALTAATVCTVCACTKRLDETQWPKARDPRRDLLGRNWDILLRDLKRIGPRH